MLIKTVAFGAASSIKFEVSFREPQAHYAEIRMDIENVKRPFIDVKMPVWTPGSYLVREYSRHVESFEACDESGELLEVKKISKNTWRITSNNLDHVTINYRLYGFEVSVRTNYIDDQHAFLSPAGTFMYVDGMLDHPVEVRINPHSNWKKVSTGLDAVPGQDFTYHAPDFDILFDSPIEVGNQEIFTFNASGVLHEVAMVGGGNYDKDRLIQDFTEIIEECTRIFGVNPNKRYVFIVHHFQSGGGGLEHLNSTVLGASRNAYSSPRLYTNFLGLVAHEYFHLWFVKRLRPIELGPFDYENENYSTALWIMEGFTSYYDNLILRRTGMVNENQYLSFLAGDFNTIENKAGNDIQPVALASFDAWIKYYRQDENSANNSISYYNKGAMLAMLMDVKIIAETKGQKNLDDVLKAAYELFYVEKDRGFEEGEFAALIKDVSGVSVDEIFRAAHTVEKLDYNAYLNRVGYELKDQFAGFERPDLGATTSSQNGRIMVTSVQRGTGAWEGGLNVRDEIIGINGSRLDASGRELASIMQDAQVGDVLQVTIARDGIIRDLPITLKRNSNANYQIVPLANANAEQKRLGKIWLSLD